MGILTLLTQQRSHSYTSPVPEIPATSVVYSENQRAFGEPGISLRYAGEDLTAEAIEAGISGEQRVAETLHELAATYPNTYVFHSVKLPGHLGDMDHIVVQGNRVLLVDSKNWKGNLHYQIVQANQEEATILRNNETFAGGDVHLQRQMDEWRRTLIPLGADVMNAALVIANRTSTVESSVQVPFIFTNLDSLHIAFETTFVKDFAPTLTPYQLQKYTSMVQGYNYIDANANVAPATVAPKAQTSTFTIILMVWSILNYLTIPLLFPVAGISALIVVILTHIQLAKTRKQQRGGQGILITTLVFSYLLTTVWALAVTLVLIAQTSMMMM